MAPDDPLHLEFLPLDIEIIFR